MSRVFICHRHASEMVAGRLADSLRHDYGSDVFVDTGLRPGEKYEKKLLQTVGHAQIVLVLIEHDWANARDSLGRTLEDPQSWVRREIEYALQHDDIQVIPVLISGAAKPSKEQLPESLIPLAELKPKTISNDSWNTDVAKLKDAFGPDLWKQSQAQRHLAASLDAAREAARRTNVEQLARARKARSFRAPEVEAKAVAEDLRDFYKTLGMRARIDRPVEGGFRVEAQHAGSLRAMSGLQSAISVLVMRDGDDLLVHVTAGKWGDKALAVGLSALMPPTLVTAAYGVRRQAKLPGQTYEHVEQFLLNAVR